MSVLKLNNDEFYTFPDFLRDYASYTAAIKGNSEKTVCEYLLDLRTFFRYIWCVKNRKNPSEENFEEISIAEMTLDDVRRINQQSIINYLMFARSERSNSNTTRMRKLSAIKSFFKYAYTKRNLIDTNPAQDIDAPKKGQTLPKYLTEAEAIKLLEAVKYDRESKTSVRDFAIITLFLNTGMRLSELVSLNLTSLDHDLKKLTVRGKGNKERVIYLNNAARNALITHLKQRLDPKYVLTSDKALFLSRRQTRISNKTVQWMVNKYLDLAGLSGRGLSVHKLRHTAATLMYQSGAVDIRVLKDILGHEQLNTTQIYTHVVSQNLKDAMENNPLADAKIEANPFYYEADDD